MAVAANLRLVLRLAGQVRDRLSPDSWRIYNRLSEFATLADSTSCLGDALDRLDEAMLSLVTLSGFVIESMPRDAAWRFLSIGRRVERLQFLSAALAALLPTPGTGALQALLAVTDAELRYRSRHARGLAPQPVAEMVMLDGDNPRALRYQLESLIEHAAALPGGAGLATPLQHRLEALSSRRCATASSANWPGETRQGEAGATGSHCELLQQALAETWACGNRLADALSQRYFTHLDTRSQATASR